MEAPVSEPVRRLRVIAGPNGSGKSTILRDFPPALVGVYVNADELERALREGPLDLGAFQLTATQEKLAAYFGAHPLAERFALAHGPGVLRVQDGYLHLQAPPGPHASYYAAILAGFLRQALLAAGVSFTFETVMSSPDKVDFLAEARAAGYRTYLYFIATEDPDINVQRVAERVAAGGHPVDERKIRERYRRSLALLPQALRHTDRAYVFDNSGAERLTIAEVTGGEEVHFSVDSVPVWFARAVGLV